MKTMRVLTAALLAGALASGAWAQAAEKTAVIDQIPAGTMGYIVANNLKAAADNVDKFIADIGMGGAVKDEMPDGLMAFIKSQFKFGEGFNASGGVAAAMLDPAPFGIDMEANIKDRMSGKKGDLQLPFVVFVPSKDVDSVFAGAKDLKKEQVGKFTKITLDVGPIYAIASNGYVLLSPVDKALTSVMEATKKATGELTKDQAALIGRSDVAVQVNMKIAGPMIIKIMGLAGKKASEKAAASGAPLPSAGMMPGDFGKIMEIYKDVLAQVQGLTMAARFDKTGLVIEELVDFAPDSALGKALAAMKPKDKPLLGRLPNFSYVLAFDGPATPNAGGAAGAEIARLQKMSTDWLTGAIAKAGGGKISDETIARLNKIMEGCQQDVTSAQCVIGQATDTGGMFGVAFVIECKDAEKMKSLLADMCGVGEEVLKAALSEKAPEIKDLSITYKKNQPDAIEIAHPKITKLSEEELELLKSILGEPKVRFLVSAADKNTVVVTFGGAQAFHDAAVKAAKEGGTIPADKGVMDAMKFMPRNLVGVMVFSGTDLADLIKKGVSTLGVAPPPFKATTQTPIAIGAGVTGSTEHVVIYVPSAEIKDLMNIVNVLKGMQQGPSRPPPATPSF
ncbi:MAG: hypothetical protein ACE15C_09630 [Phycisphaerae bacterium]